MKKLYYLLFSMTVVSVTGFAQDDSSNEEVEFDAIKSELIDWDPIRGKWLSESLIAHSNGSVVPDRTFPEEFTTSEVWSYVPQDRREKIQSRIISNQQATAKTNPELNRRWSRMAVITSPRTCQPVMARTYGDPHLTSFDGASYSFQTVGEFVLSKASTGDFEVQARQEPQSNDISLNTAVAMNVSGDRVGIYARDLPDEFTGTPIRLDGQPLFLENETYYLPHGGTIRNSGKNYVVTWPSGEQVNVDLRRSGSFRFMNIAVNVFPCSSTLDGVLGNANGDKRDDFDVRGNRSQIASSVFTPFGDRTFDQASNQIEKEYLAFLAKDFANQYRVTNETTLFDYGFGKSSWTYTDESFPRVHRTLGDMTPDQRTSARRYCEDNGIRGDELSGCIYDRVFVNLPANPRPVISNPTSGRTLTQIDSEVPNVNRPGVNRPKVDPRRETDPTPSSQTIDKPTIGDRTENGDSEVDSKPSIGSTPIEKPATKDPAVNTTATPKPNVPEKPTFPTFGKKPTTGVGNKPVGTKPTPVPSQPKTPTRTPDPKPPVISQPKSGGTTIIKGGR